MSQQQQQQLELSFDFSSTDGGKDYFFGLLVNVGSISLFVDRRRYEVTGALEDVVQLGVVGVAEQDVGQGAGNKDKYTIHIA